MEPFDLVESDSATGPVVPDRCLDDARPLPVARSIWKAEEIERLMELKNCKSGFTKSWTEIALAMNKSKDSCVSQWNRIKKNKTVGDET